MVLKENPIGITFTFDDQTNVKSEQLLEVVIMTSEKRLYI